MRAERRDKTSKLVLSNRQQGPEIVMQMVEDRAPDGFARLSDVISRAELEDVANRYKAVAGFELGPTYYAELYGGMNAASSCRTDDPAGQSEANKRQNFPVTNCRLLL